MRKLLSLITSFFLATVAVAESDISDVRALEERFKKMDFVAEWANKFVIPPIVKGAIY